MSHTFASLGPAPEARGASPHSISLVHLCPGLQASNSQKTEGRAPALKEKTANGTILLIAGKTSY